MEYDIVKWFLEDTDGGMKLIIFSIVIMLGILAFLFIRYLIGKITTLGKFLVSKFKIKGKIKVGDQELVLEGGDDHSKPDKLVKQMIKEINKETSVDISISIQEVLGFVEVASELSRELVKLKYHKTEFLLKHLRILERDLRNKFESQLTNFLCEKYKFCSDDVLENEHYYYLMSVYDSVFRQIESLWENAFERNGFAEEDKDDYIKIKLAEIYQIIGDYVRSSFKSRDITKAELIKLFNSIEYSLTEFNKYLFDKSLAETVKTDAEIIEKRSNLEKIRTLILSYRQEELK
jgi:hypothetical protein